MSKEWILTLLPVAGLGADLIAQMTFAHLTHRTNQSIAIGAVCGLVVTAVLFFRMPGSSAAVWIVGMLTYGALAFGYWAFLNLNLTSLRIRMIRELLHSRDGISRGELMRRYSPEEFLRRRLERLEHSSKQLQRGPDGRWRLRSRTLLTVARIMAFARLVIIPGRETINHKK